MFGATDLCWTTKTAMWTSTANNDGRQLVSATQLDLSANPALTVTSSSELPRPTSSSVSPSAASVSSCLVPRTSSAAAVLAMEAGERGSNLSGGFAQSVALARAFLRPQSRVMILDEAMSAMDPIKKREFILPRLFAFVQRHAMTLIIVTHDVAQVCPLVDRVYVMDAARVAQSGTHNSLVERQAQPYCRLLGMQTT